MLETILLEIKDEFPKFRVIRKDESTFMKIISLLLKVITFGAMNKFMSDFTTTVGYKVYVPTTWDLMPEISRAIVMRHERIHMRQRQRLGWFLFSVAYLFLPLPIGLAYFRARFELEAYAESIRASADYYGSDSIKNSEFQSFIVGHFTTSEYVWCWPFKSMVEGWIKDVVEDVVREREGKI